LSPPPESRNLDDTLSASTGEAPECFADLTDPTQGIAARDTRPELRAPALDLTRGQRVGRYVVLETLGAGGMGVVYRAYDPDLDRHVALKLISPRSSGDATQESRLFREAQALARLSHENVVAVHDVGLHEGRMFVAMELVPGQTLNKWLREAARSQREILSVFVAAGRGLAAAHDAGLVHRDFKPSNVIVGNDGRVRVLDFGLARATGELANERTSISPSSDTSLMLSSPLTADGVLVGTPHYMAPEQLREGGGSARSDQFCFCLTLWEALTGYRPFTGGNVKELLERLESGKPDPSPGDARLPAWVRRILLRGLSPDPEQRYASMDALIVELRRDPMRRLKPLLVSAATALLAGALVATTMHVRRDRDALVSRCDAADAGIRELWNPAARARIARAFDAHGGPYGGEAMKRVDATLSSYVQDWGQISRDACLATWVRGTRSEALLDRQSMCLEKRRASFAALVHELGSANELATVTAAVPSVLALPAPAACADLDALAHGPSAPQGAAQREELSRARKAMAEAEARMLAGHSEQGLTILEPWVSKVRALRFPPLELELLQSLAGLETTTPGKHAGAENTYDQALRLAASLGDDAATARLWIDLVGALGNDLGRPQDAYAQRRAAELALSRVGVAPADLRRADLAHNLALAAWNSGRNDEALALCKEALTIRERALGKSHHSVGNSLNLLGILLSERGDFGPSADAHKQALEVRKSALGEHHPYVADSLDNLGVVRQYQGRVSEALALHEQALQLRERVYGPDHPDVGTSLNNVGSLKLELGDAEAAARMFERTLRIWEKALSPEDTSFAIALINLGDVALARGDARDASDKCQRALDIESAAVEPDSPTLAWQYTCLGEAEILSKRPQKALPWLEKALTLRLHGDALERARTELALSHALALTHSDRKRALELVEAARRTFEAAGPLGALRLAQSDQVLATLGSR
jgi:serine/threonine-protein kinase